MHASPPATLACFDFDGTLTRKDTMLAFSQFVHSPLPWSWRIVRLSPHPCGVCAPADPQRCGQRALSLGHVWRDAARFPACPGGGILQATGPRSVAARHDGTVGVAPGTRPRGDAGDSFAELLDSGVCTHPWHAAGLFGSGSNGWPVYGPPVRKELLRAGKGGAHPADMGGAFSGDATSGSAVCLWGQPRRPGDAGVGRGIKKGSGEAPFLVGIETITSLRVRSRCFRSERYSLQRRQTYPQILWIQSEKRWQAEAGRICPKL